MHYAEFFPNIIFVIPRGNTEAKKLFEPINNLARPLSSLAKNCMRGRSADCLQYRYELETLIKNDTLKFDRARHKQSAVSFTTGTLGGNLIIRSIVLNFREIQHHQAFSGFERNSLISWLDRRSQDFKNIPEKINFKNLDNHVLHSVLTDLAIYYLRNESKEMDDFAYRQARLVYQSYIENTRADGSMPNQTRRGVYALKYTNSALGALSMLGYLLEERESGVAKYVGSNGVDLPRMTAYYLSAVADEGSIIGYSSENYAPTDKTAGNVLARGYMAEHHSWIGLYARIWPNTHIAKELQKLKDRTISDADEYFDEILGFIISCQ